MPGPFGGQAGGTDGTGKGKTDKGSGGNAGSGKGQTNGSSKMGANSSQRAVGEKTSISGKGQGFTGPKKDTPSKAGLTDKEFNNAVRGFQGAVADENDAGETPSNDLLKGLAGLLGFDENADWDKTIGRAKAGQTPEQIGKADWSFDLGSLAASIGSALTGMPMGLAYQGFKSLTGFNGINASLGQSVFDKNATTPGGATVETGFGDNVFDKATNMAGGSQPAKASGGKDHDSDPRKNDTGQDYQNTTGFHTLAQLTASLTPGATPAAPAAATDATDVVGELLKQLKFPMFNKPTPYQIDYKEHQKLVADALKGRIVA